MHFHHIRIEDKKLFDDLIARSCLFCESSYEQSFATLFCFSEDLSIKISDEQETIYILSEEKGQKVFYPPLCKTEKAFVAAIKRCMEYAKECGFPFVVEGITEKQKSVIEDSGELYCAFSTDRNNFEYLYDPKEFISYNERLQAYKIDQMKGFEKRYGSLRRPYEPSDLTKIEELFKVWLGNRNISEYDYKPMLKALKHIDKLGLVASCLLDKNDVIIGLSIGEIDARGVGTVLFEKAEHKYFGSNAALVSYFARDYLSDCKYVNRQEDMGLEGLRYSKLSYLVERFIVKYKMTSGFSY